jgi:hypothetical protein
MLESDYMKVTLPRWPGCVSVFVDRETESKPSIVNTADGETGKNFLGRLYLDHLGAAVKWGRVFGLHRTLYIAKLSPPEEPPMNSEDDVDSNHPS